MMVGTLTASLSREAGGMFESVRGLCKATSQHPDVDLRVFGLRDDVTEKDIEKWGQLAVSAHDVIGPRAFGFSPGLARELMRSSIDILHLHGIWMYPSVAALRWARATRKPHIISPHGMLDSVAISFSAWKKSTARLLYEGANLREAACLRALCVSEAAAMRRLGLKNPIAVIANGVDMPCFSESAPLPAWSREAQDDAKVLLFFGRLHRKKGLPELLRAWKIARTNSCDNWRLVIAGWANDDYGAELEDLARILGIGNSVQFVGPQFGAEKRGSFRRADAFILPSSSEGLPVAVMEAWSYSLPSLITPECNFPEAFVLRAALSIEQDVGSIANELEKLFAMDALSLRAMGERGRKLVEEHYAWEEIGKSMVAVYKWLLGEKAAPDCVLLD